MTGTHAEPARAAPRDLPAVDRLLRADGGALVSEHGNTLVAQEARRLLDELRDRVAKGDVTRAELEPSLLAALLRERVEARLAPRLRPVLNLSGVVVHTNLGRALLPDAALDHLVRTMRGANNLEYDLAGGGRGDRDDLVESLLMELTGAEAATVVNNNAAAVMLSLAALATGKEVIVSRGELVEIGGSFRVPDVMRCAGAQLVEVGTTNRTHAADYERAINERTAALMKIHASNYAIQGFTASVEEDALARIAHEHHLPLVCDLGSGALVDFSKYGLPKEPLPGEKIAAGCDLVTFSGDKVLGGPQAGLIVGTREQVQRVRKHPMKRALRVSKLVLAALEATLALYLRPERLPCDLPTLRMLVRPQAEIRQLAGSMLAAVAAALAPRFSVQVVDCESQIGSGSLPVERLPSAGLALAPLRIDKKGLGSALDELARALRDLPLPVVGRITRDQLLLDLRCLEDGRAFLAQLPLLHEALHG